MGSRKKIKSFRCYFGFNKLKIGFKKNLNKPYFLNIVLIYFL